MDVSKVLTTATLAKAVATGVRSGLKRGKRFVKQTFAQKHLWWIFPLVVWAIGMIIIWEIWKNYLRTLEASGVKIPPIWKSGSFLQWIGEICVSPFTTWWGKQTEPPEEQKPEIEEFINSMKVWIAVWSIICIVLAMWLYSSKQERQWGRPIFIDRRLGI